MKKMYALLLTVLLFIPNMPVMAMTREVDIITEYTEHYAELDKFTYLFDQDNKNMLDLIYESTLPTADDWCSTRIREAANIAYFNLENASSEMRAAILTARYEIVLSKAWTSDEHREPNDEKNVKYFYDLFPADWTYPIINSEGDLLDPISGMFVSLTYIPTVYNAPSLVNTGDIIPNTLEFGVSGGPGKITPYLTYYENTLIHSERTFGGAYFVYIGGNGTPPFIPFRAEFYVNENTGKGFQLDQTSYIMSMNDQTDWSPPSFSPVDLMIYGRTVTSENGPVSMFIYTY